MAQNCQIDPSMQFTESGIASATINPGCAVNLTTDYDGITNTYVAITSGYARGIAMGVRVGGGTQEAYAAGDVMQIAKNSSEAIALLGGTACTSLQIPLKATTAGALIPCTTNNDAAVAWPMETGAANTYIRVQVCNFTWGQ